jgi:hypothetical protein
MDASLGGDVYMYTPHEHMAQCDNGSKPGKEARSLPARSVATEINATEMADSSLRRWHTLQQPASREGILVSQSISSF